MADMVNIGGLEADLVLNTSKLEAGVANAERALFVIRDDVRRLDIALKQGEISIQDYAREIIYLSESENNLNAAVLAASGAVQQQAAATNNAAKSAAAMNAALQRSRAAGMALMQLGYIADDVQYGFRSIVNNIGPLAYSVTTAMGMANEAAMKWGAGIQVAAVAGYQLYNNWDQLMEVIGIGRVLTEAEEMEVLASKTGKTADETARLNKYKREQAEIDALLDKKPKAEAERDKAVKDAIVEHGSKKVLDGIFRSLIAEGRGEKMTPQERENMDIINRDFGKDSPFAKMKQQEIDKRIEAENIRKSRDILGNPEKLDTLKALAKAHPDAFPKDFLKDVEKVLPEGKSRDLMVKQQADLDAYNLEQSTAGMEKIDKDKKKAADEEKDFDSNAENVFKSAVKETKDMIPGVEKVAQANVMGALLGGGPNQIAAVHKQIKDQLMAQGVNEGVASKATEEILKDAGAKTKEDVINEMLNGTGENEEKKKETKSQKFDATELAARVQQGVSSGDNEQKKQTGLLTEMKRSLANIEQMKGGLFVR